MIFSVEPEFFSFPDLESVASGIGLCDQERCVLKRGWFKDVVAQVYHLLD